MLARRDVLKGLAAASASFPAACTGSLPGPSPFRNRLIDAHCHVFNATDLPAARFIRYIFLSQPPEQGTERALAVEDPDFIDGLIALFIALTAGSAPTAREEIEVFDGRRDPDPRIRNAVAAQETAIERTAAFLAQGAAPARASVRGEDAVRAAILDAGGMPAEGRLAPPSTEDMTIAARRAFASPSDIGVYLRWFSLYSRYRHDLADQLAGDHDRQGFKSVLLPPAMVDFSRWLGEEPTSPLRDQVEAMARLSLRPSGPAVHGFVAYDPLREVYFRRGLGEPESPLALVREAVTEHGFVGAKIYPPMGFRPSGNGGQTYPERVLRDLDRRVSADLNAALDEFYALCAGLGAPILAHAAETNGPNRDYMRRADPHYWIPVFRRFPELRVCLAHFGSFAYASQSAPTGAELPESSWEWTFGRYIAEKPDAPVYADLGYFDEVLDADEATRARFAGRLTEFIARFDPNVRHLVFGTDWNLLGRERSYPTYTTQVVDFLENDCRLSAMAVQRILVENAATFMGLREGQPTRERLLAFYARHSLRASRLPDFPAEGVVI
jgi:predicted TIM-barrel fold metal-dependent hydrolase